MVQGIVLIEALAAAGSVDFLALSPSLPPFQLVLKVLKAARVIWQTIAVFGRRGDVSISVPRNFAAKNVPVS